MNSVELIQLASDLSVAAPEKISVWGGVVIRLKKEGIDMFANAIRDAALKEAIEICKAVDHLGADLAIYAIEKRMSHE